MLGPRLGFTHRTTRMSSCQWCGGSVGLLPLHLRSQHADLLCLCRLLNGHIDYPALLDSIELFITRWTRSRLIFCRQNHPTICYDYNNGISRVVRTGGSTRTWTWTSSMKHPHCSKRKRRHWSSKRYLVTQLFLPFIVLIVVFRYCIFLGCYLLSSKYNVINASLNSCYS